MPTKIVNVSELGADLEIGATGDLVGYGQEVEVDSDLADQLIATGQWARPTTKAAKQAEKESDS